LDFTLWLSYIGVIGLLIIFPGPSALLCLSHGLTYGKAYALATVFGGAIAALCLMSLSAIGLGAILAASGQAFFIVKLIGAFYLIYLGFNLWRNSLNAIHLNTIEQVSNKTTSRFSLFKTGFIVGISNPKDLLFFAALFPNFIRIDQPQLMQFIILASSWFVLDMLFMFMYSSMGTKIEPWFLNKRQRQRFNRATGGVFALLGGGLLLSSAQTL
jgi:homoserine/homoserine lactone efflux protein